VRTYFECQRCTACCRWPGQVRQQASDIAALAAHLGLSEREFIHRHTRLNAHRTGLALRNKPNGECEFLAGRDCEVQAANPDQCGGFPNRWHFPGFREVCQAAAVEMSDEAYERRVNEGR
jgi:Fe-S-cluster containining protein